MKTIIAGTDFTPASINACRYGALLAQSLNCKLVIFNLYQIPVYHSNAGLIGITFPTLQKESKHGVEIIIADLAKDFPGLKINALSSSNAMKSELEHYTKKHQVMAVVMGLEVKDKISKFIYGSQGVNMGEKLDVPVIIVPGQYVEHQFKSMLLALDNKTRLKTETLQVISDFADVRQLYFKVLHIRTPEEIISPSRINSLKIGSNFMEIETLKSATIENGVKKYCTKNNVDMVAIISRKHSVFYKLFNETLTKRLAFVSNVPVLVLHE